MTQDLFTVKEAAEWAGVTTAAVYAWMQMGLQPAWQGKGGKTLLSRASLLTFVPPAGAPRGQRFRAHERGDRTLSIEAAIESRYPCMALPYGALTDLAVEYGVTREWVRRVAGRIGATGTRTGNRPNARPRVSCGRCGKPFQNPPKSAAVCRDCRSVDLPCTFCGKPKRVSAASLARKVNEDARVMPGGTSARYTGRVFCDRQCFGKWFGLTYGYGARKAHREAQAVAS